MNVVESSPSAADLALLPGRLALQAASGAISATVTIVTLPVRLMSLLSAAEEGLANLDAMTRGVSSMEGDMLQMRESLVKVISVLEGVESGVVGMEGAVDGIRNATVSLDTQLDGLQGSLHNIDILAARLTRFTASGRKARALARELDKQESGSPD